MTDPITDYDEGCPKCGKESHCPCRSCAKMNKGKVLWVWDETGELISCGHCGYTMHADGWLDFAMSKQYKSEVYDEGWTSMTEPDVISLEYGLTPFDSMSHDDLLLHAKRLYDACNSMSNCLGMMQAGDAYNSSPQPYWTVGSGAKALSKGEQALEAINKGYSTESIYRNYYRYATDLLFKSTDTVRIGSGWVVCTQCKEMWAAGDNFDQQGRFKDGLPCTGWAKHPDDRTCKGVYRLLSWDDLKPMKDETL